MAEETLESGSEKDFPNITVTRDMGGELRNCICRDL